MPKNLHGRLAGALSLLLLSGTTQAHRDETQLWISQGAAIEVAPATTLGIDTSERLSDQSSAKNQVLARLIVLRKVAKGVEIGAGLTYSRTGGVNEYRPFEEMTLSRGVLALRSRLEQRMFDNADRTVWRLRERLQVSLPLDRAKNWTATVSGETLFNLNQANAAKQTGLTQVRALVGIRRAINPKLSLTLSYQRQQTLVSGGEDVVTHQPILSLSARF
jgi:hypothetical protein